MKQSGRSMVEILAVLAIVGVLTIGASAGYRFAMIKYKSNEIINGLTQRALLFSTALMTGQNTDSVEAEIGTTLTSGNEVSFEPIEDADIFALDVFDVQADVCTNVVETYTVPSIVVNGAFVEAGYKCPEDTDMTFIYRNDLSGNLGDDYCTMGDFDPATLTCHCFENAYPDPSTGDCLCPAGYAASEEERKCVENPCKKGFFPDLSGECIDCTSKAAHKIDKEYKSVCTELCDNRGYNEDYARCFSTELCTEGVDYLNNANDGCLSCDNEKASTPMAGGGDAKTYGKKTCNACTGKRYWANGYCLKKDICMDTAVKSFPNKLGNCISCDSTALEGEAIRVENDPTNESYLRCQACGNRDVQQSLRKTSAGEYLNFYYCVKTTCGDNDFKGEGDRCYSCDEQTAITATETECAKCGAKRTRNDNGFCTLSTCPDDGDHVETSDGSCYTCDKTGYFNTTEAECKKCGTKRVWISLQKDIGHCQLPCPTGTYPQEYNETCIGCGSIHRAGISADGIKACLACTTGDGKYQNYMEGYHCVPGNYCKEGTEFLPYPFQGVTCASCSFNDKIKIGVSDEQINWCLKCNSPKRFYAQEYCYRCDEHDEVLIKTDDERDYCEACGGLRKVVIKTSATGKEEEYCILKTEGKK